MKVTKILVSVVLFVLISNITVHAGTLKFDFGPSNTQARNGSGLITAAPGYIWVDETMGYGAQSINGHDYGFTNVTSANDRSAFYPTMEPFPVNLSLSEVAVNVYTGSFDLEVPNGDYTVTLFAGNVGWDMQGYIEVENTIYGGSQNNSNLYMVDVAPDDNGFLTWTQDQGYTKHAPLAGGTLDQIQTWGAGPLTGSKDYHDYMEALYLENQTVTVTDNKLTIVGATDFAGGAQGRMSYLEITGEGISNPEPPPFNKLKFDFGPHNVVNTYGVPVVAAPGYIYVDETISYGLDPKTGLTYGMTNVLNQHERGDWQTRNSPSTLTLTQLDVDVYTGSFDLEVPNGDYYVTVAGGSVSWSSVGYIEMEGTIYGGTNNNSNLYMVDVIPDKTELVGFPPGLFSDGYLTWTQDQDYTKHAPLSGVTFDQITTWGGGFPEPILTVMEILYLENQLITVTDGKITIRGATDFANGVARICFVEVWPATCQAILEAGYGLKEDLNEDCQVNFADFAQLEANWMMCNDPDCL
jgi:hypothetical protein